MLTMTQIASKKRQQGNNVHIVRSCYPIKGKRFGPFNKQRVSFTVSHYAASVKRAFLEFCINPALFIGEFLRSRGVAPVKLGKNLGASSFLQRSGAHYFGDEYSGNTRSKNDLIVGITGAAAVANWTDKMTDGVVASCKGI